MNKALVLFLIAIVLIPTASAACAENQRIFRISSQTNAHAELYNGTGNYPEEICWTSAKTHDCDGSNTLLHLSNSTNAHAEQSNQSNYLTDICFGNLECAYGANCAGDETCIATISSATNAHVSSLCTGAGSYPIKLCCKEATSLPSASCSIAIIPSTINEGQGTTATVTYNDFAAAPVRTSWSCGAGGPAPSSWSCGAGTCTFTCSPYASAGSYTITAILNESGACGSQTLTVNGTNSPPETEITRLSVEDVGVVNPAPASYTVTTGTWINFTGEATDPDAGDSITQHRWSCTASAGTCPAIFAPLTHAGSGNPDTDSTGSVSFNTVGSYTITYNAYDGEAWDPTPATIDITVNDSAVESCTITVLNDPINILQSTNIQVAYSNFSTTPSFNSKNCGGGGATPTAGVCGAVGNGNCNYSCGTYNPAGTYTIQTTLNDGGALVACTTDTVTVNGPGNSAPTANAGVNRTTQTGTAITQNGTCDDTDGTITSCSWAAPGCTINSQVPAGTGTANASNSLNVTCSGSVGTTFTITLTATDNDGATDTDSFTTTIIAAGNNPPTATIKIPASNQNINTGDTITFEGEGTDTDGTIDTHEWTCTATLGTCPGNFPSNLEDPGNITFNTEGNYEISYRVQDDDGDWDPTPDTRNIVTAVFGTNIKITQFNAEPLAFEADQAILDSMLVKVKNISDAQANVTITVEVLDPTTNQAMNPEIISTSNCGIIPVGTTCEKNLADFPEIDFINLQSGAYKISAKALSGGGTALEDEEALFFIIKKQVAVPELSLAMIAITALAVLFIASNTGKKR